MKFPLMTAKQVAERLNVSPRHVHRLPLGRVKITQRCIRFFPDEVEALVKQRNGC